MNIVSSAIITSTDFGFWSFKEVGNRYGNFSMATMFPRRVFTAEDMNKTLVELELAPSASIVILPVSRPVPLGDSSVRVEPPPHTSSSVGRFSATLACSGLN